MFNWFSKQLPAASQTPDLPGLARLREQDLAVVFKHSPSCPVSWAAETQVKRFARQNPRVPVYTILVRRDRELSRQIAEFTGIRHESPQVIVLRKGAVVAGASHEEVTAEFLARATGPAAPTGGGAA